MDGQRKCLFFAHQPGINSSEEIASQMMSQMDAAFVGSTDPPEFELIEFKDTQRAVLSDTTNGWYVFANLCLCEMLGLDKGTRREST